MSAIVLVMVLGGCACMAIAAAVVIAQGPGPGVSSSPVDVGVFRPAMGTFYNSYPACCKDSPTYNPSASKTECSDYSGCKYMGMFAGLNGKQSYEWVRDTNLAAIFEVGQTEDTWKSKFANKKVRVRNPSSGKTIDVTVVDRCDDGDCGGCCTKNAQKNGGVLVDLEYNTAKRLFGNSVPGETMLEWKFV